MKYLMGLILSFALTAGAFAQDTRQESGNLDQCVQACLDKSESNQQNLNDQTESERFENGSIYYHEDPDLGVGETETDADARVEDTTDMTGTDTEIEIEGEADADVEAEESTDVTKEIREGAKDAADAVGEGAEKVGEETKELFTDETPDAETSDDIMVSAGSGLWKMENQCALHKQLNERSGVFKLKKDLGDAELKMERERDGEENLKYKSDTEIYSYEKNEKGEEKYYYSIRKDNERIEYLKDNDGETEVIYHGVFNSPEEAANIIDEGVSFEGFSSVCSE
jgi:hypothetical protein